MSGTTIVTKAAAVRMCHWSPRVPTSSFRRAGITATSEADPQVHEGHEQVVPDPQELEDGECQGQDRQGQDRRVNTVKWEAPSMNADSIRSFGSWLMKL